MGHEQLVALVDDDHSIRESLPPLLRSYGLEVEVFASAEQLLSHADLARIGCFVLDVGLPDMTGPSLQKALVRRGIRTPVVFITARSSGELDADLSGRSNVIACLAKPFTEKEIIDSVREGLAAQNRS